MSITRTGFQSFVNNQLPVGVAGDFASANVTASVLGGPGQYVAPAGGTTVGVMAWFNPTTGLATNYYTAGSFLAFVHRANQGLITAFLGISTVQVVPGNMVTGLGEGDFWGVFASGSTIGQKVYANAVTGALTSAATGGSVTGSYTATTVTSNVMTTTDANLTNTAAAVGQLVTGGTLPEGTYIASSAGTGSGTHLWNLANANGTTIPDQGSFTSSEFGVQETVFTVASTAAANVTTATSSIAVTGILTTGGATSGGAIQVGDLVSGTGVPANTFITAQLTGTTGAGSGATYQTTAAAVVTSATFTYSQGQLGKITSWNG